jgi:hypothetical protein
MEWFVKEGNAMSVVVSPSARETFTPRELTDAYKDFETGIKAGVYRLGERVLLVYEEPGIGLVVLVHPTPPRKVRSQKIERDSWAWQPRTSARRSP